MDNLTVERKNTLNHASQIVDAAKSARRELTSSDQDSVEADLARDGLLEQQINGRRLFMSVMNLGSRSDLRETRGGIFTDEAKTGMVRTVRTRSSYRTDVYVKAAITTGTPMPPLALTSQVACT